MYIYIYVCIMPRLYKNPPLQLILLSVPRIWQKVHGKAAAHVAVLWKPARHSKTQNCTISECCKKFQGLLYHFVSKCTLKWSKILQDKSLKVGDRFNPRHSVLRMVLEGVLVEKTSSTHKQWDFCANALNRDTTIEINLVQVQDDCLSWHWSDSSTRNC